MSSLTGGAVSPELILLDGLVKKPIYVVVDLKRQLAVPHVLPSRRYRYYTWYTELLPEPICSARGLFNEIILL